MKWFTYIFLIGLLITSNNSIAQSSQDVSFVHGLGDTPTVWDDMASDLGQEFIFNRDNVTYNSTSAISTAVSGTSFPTNTVTVAHSLGGLISREYIKQNGLSSMKALITLGTPHNGAPVADAIQSNVIRDLSGAWYNRLLKGPMASATIIAFIAANEIGAPPANLDNFRQNARYFIEGLLQYFGLDPNSVSGGLATYINQIYGNYDSVDDLRPGSSFLAQLNSSPGNTLPGARYAIYGKEDLYSFIRLFSSFQQKEIDGNPMEGDAILKAYYGYGSLWLFWAVVHSIYSFQYQLKAADVGYGHPDYFKYLDYSALYAYAAREWFLGFVNFAVLMPIEWKANIPRSISESDLINLNFSNIEADDGLLNKSTQAPTFFNTFGDGIDRGLDADGANHLEETVHPSVKERLSEIFQIEGIPPVDDSGGGGGDPIDPPPLPGPCYDEYGNQIICPN